jgi:hypothetical protein
VNVNIKLDVKYHRQDDWYYCGAACGMMILEFLNGGPIPGFNLWGGNMGQTNYFKIGHTVTRENGDPNAAGVYIPTLHQRFPWAIDPLGMAAVLASQRGPDTPNLDDHLYVLHRDNDCSAITQEMWYRMSVSGAPAAALVFGRQHWVVVFGMDADKNPDSLQITGLWIHDPWPATAGSGYPPASFPYFEAVPMESDQHRHLPENDRCGTAGDMGVASTWLSYAGWADTYMTGVPEQEIEEDTGRVCQSRWFEGGRFIAFMDHHHPLPSPPPPPPPPQPLHKRATKPMSVGRIKTRVLSAVKKASLMRARPWAKTVLSSRSGTPVLVDRLDRDEATYAVVPLIDPAGRIRLLTRMDAHTEEVLDCTRWRTAGAQRYPAITKEEAVQLVAGRTFRFPGSLSPVVVDPDGLGIHPRLVWKPCRESLSPLAPFYMMYYGRHRLFVRTDGAVFAHLSTAMGGL